MIRLVLLIWGVSLMLLGGLAPCLASQESLLITYGPDAQIREGDDDFTQIIHFRLPVTSEAPLYLRVFDADIGGQLDAAYRGAWNTSTSFRFFGDIPQPGATDADLAALQDRLIVEERFGVDPFRDNSWYTLTSFAPSAGRIVDGYALFSLVVQGLSGDDGNVFSAVISQQEKRNVPPVGLEQFTYRPTLHLPNSRSLAELRFTIPQTAEKLVVSNFDAPGARLRLETPVRDRVKVTPSEQGKWTSTTLDLTEDELGALAALTFFGGAEMPNDATFMITAEPGGLLPVELPIYLRRPNQRPNPKVDFEVLANCRSVVFDGSRSSDRDGDTLSFRWDFGDGTVKEGIRLTHRYDSFGVFAGQLQVRDDSGHVGNLATTSFQVPINHPPLAEAGPDQQGEPGQLFQFDAGASTDPDGDPLTYRWDFGDGLRQEGGKVEHRFAQSGFYQVKLRVEDNSMSPCNNASDVLEVWVNAPPVVDAGDHRTTAVGEKIVFDQVRAHDSDGEITDYRWDFGDGHLGTGAEPTHRYEAPGTYLVKLRVSDSSSAPNDSASDTLQVVVNAPPIPQITVATISVAVGDEVAFSAENSHDPDGRLIAYRWDFADGVSRDGIKTKHIYKAPGSYNVTLSVSDDSGTASATAQIQQVIRVNHPPVAEAGKDRRVTSSVVFFDGSGSSDKDGSLIDYLWDFGDGKQASGMQVAHLYQTPGTYQVTLSVTDDSETVSRQQSDTATIIINQAPIADAGADQIAAPQTEVQFDASRSVDPDGDLVAYQWEFGDGNKAQGSSVAHTFEHVGAYQVRLTVHDDSGDPQAVDYDELRVLVNAPPIPLPGPPIYTSPKLSVTFDAGMSFDPDGEITGYIWQFSDGTSSEKAKVEHTFAAPGLYVATLTVIDDSGVENGIAHASVNVHVNHQPTPQIVASSATCELTVPFAANSSVDADGDALTYRWDFGDDTPAVYGEKVVHGFPAAGAYPILLTADDGSHLKNATATVATTVEINHPPQAVAGDNRTVCAGEVVLLDGSQSLDPDGGPLKFHWDFGDGSQAEKMNPTKVFKSGGVFPVTLSVKDDSGLACNTDSDQFIVTVAESPVAIAGPDLQGCVNRPIRFDGTASSDIDGKVNRFSWDFGDGNIGGGDSPTHVYTEPGVYHVLLTIDGDLIGTCNNRDADEMIVTVLDGPSAIIDLPHLVAVNDDVTFDATASDAKGLPVVSQRWDFGDGTVAQGSQVHHRYTKPGRYSVTYFMEVSSEAGCNTVSTEKLIRVNGPPVAEAGPDQTAARQAYVTFDASASGDADGSISHYHWDFDDGTEATGLQVRHRFDEAGEYTVQLEVRDDTNLGNNVATDTLRVKVNAEPIAALNAPETACPGDILNFDAAASNDSDGDPLTYQWDFGDGKNSTGEKVSHTYTTPGSYGVSLRVDDGSQLANSQASSAATVVVNRPPLAYFSHRPKACPGETVRFDASGSFDRDGELQSYQWRFGDGEQASGESVEHTFATAGSYPIDLVVSDNAQASCREGATRSQIMVNKPPTADAGADQSGFTGGAHDDFIFDASGSSDQDGDSLSYFWDFGDGATATGAKVRHYYQKPGDYRVRLQINDGSQTACATAVDWATVHVNLHGEEKVSAQ